MSAFASFHKSFFGGFRESDVIRYLDGMMKEHQKETARLKERLEKAEEELRTRTGQLSAVCEEVERLKREPKIVETIKEVAVPPAGMEEELAQLWQQNKTLSDLAAARDQKIADLQSALNDIRQKCSDASELSAALGQVLSQCRELTAPEVAQP